MRPEADRIVVGSAHSVLIVRAKHSNTELHLSGHEGTQLPPRWFGVYLLYPEPSGHLHFKDEPLANSQRL